MNRRFCFPLFIFLFVSAGFTGGSPSVCSAEDFQWQHSTCAEHNIDQKVVDQVFKSLADDVYSCVIVRDGVIVDEHFKEGYDKDSVFTLQSVSKSITSALFGIAMSEGYIKSVNDKAADYIPQLAASKNNVMKQVTLRQLLNMTSGMTGTDTRIWNQWRSSSDWIDFIVSRPMLHEPGKYFEYSTGSTHLLSAVIENATGQSLNDYAQKKLFSRTGIKSGGCGTGPEGTGDGGNGFYMTAYDMARFGLLYLNNGVWQGQQVVPSDWVKASTSIQAVKQNSGSRYGYQWWMRWYGNAGYFGYCAQGWYGEYIFVVPQLNMVVVFTSMHEGSYIKYFEDINKIVNGCRKN